METELIYPDIRESDISELIMDILKKEGVDTTNIQDDINEIIETACSILSLRAYREGYKKGIKVATDVIVKRNSRHAY